MYPVLRVDQAPSLGSRSACHSAHPANFREQRLLAQLSRLTHKANAGFEIGLYRAIGRAGQAGMLTVGTAYFEDGKEALEADCRFARESQ
jgi:hypothetical protein